MAGGHADTGMSIGRPILVPLTTSLYVPGTLADKDNVIVDVGTGFYVEKVWIKHLYVEEASDNRCRARKMRRYSTKQRWRKWEII